MEISSRLFTEGQYTGHASAQRPAREKFTLPKSVDGEIPSAGEAVMQTMAEEQSLAQRLFFRQPEGDASLRIPVFDGIEETDEATKTSEAVQASEDAGQESDAQKPIDAADLLQKIKEQILESYMKQQGAEEDNDWRTMDDDKWEKLLKQIDEYLDAYHEDLKERMEKAETAATEKVSGE